MSLVLKDRVRETTTVLGTSDATLLGAVTGFQAFSVVGNGNTCYYTISDQSGGNWEVGIGTYSTVGPTLARTTILASSNSGSIVSFPAGTKDVFLTLPAEVAVVSSNNPSTAGYVLSSNGTGVAPSWVAGTSITVGAAGSNTQVQYNNSGVLGASSNFTFDGTNIGLAAGTANGVAYLNGSKVLTTGSALTFDGTNLSIVKSSSANLSIGTFNGAYAYTNVIKVDTAGGYPYYAGLDLYDGGSVNSYIRLNSGTSAIAFGASGSEQMRLTSTGLGIGTSSPGAKLDVQNNGDVTARSYSTNASNLSFVQAVNSAGTYIGLLQYGASHTSYGALGAGKGALYSTDNVTIMADTSTGIINFATGGNTERMRLDSSGNLGLGVTPSAWNTFIGMQIGSGGLSLGSYPDNIFVGSNVYFGAGQFRYAATGYSATNYRQVTGQHQWLTDGGGSGTAGNAISFTQAMTLDASGKLGIGTSSPLYYLDVRLNQYGFANFENSNAAGYSGVQIKDPNQPILQLTDGTNNFQIYGGGNQVTLRNYANGPMVFMTNSTERMRIDSSGNVGIGTTAPGSKLSIVSTSNSQLQFGYNDSIYGRVGRKSDGDYELSSYENGSSILFGTTTSTGSTTERMRIDSTGNVTITQAGRATITTDNDGSFDMNAASNFKCTPTGTFALTFTNIASAGGQSGYILLVNTGGYAITAAATTKVGSSFLTTVSAAGTYLLSYFSDATNVYVTTSGALS